MFFYRRKKEKWSLEGIVLQINDIAQSAFKLDKTIRRNYFGLCKTVLYKVGIWGSIFGMEQDGVWVKWNRNRDGIELGANVIRLSHCTRLSVSPQGFQHSGSLS